MSRPPITKLSTHLSNEGSRVVFRTLDILQAILFQEIEGHLEPSRGILVQRQGMARVRLDVELDGTRIGERVVEGLEAGDVLAVAGADEKVQLGQDVVDWALEWAGSHDEEAARGELGHGGGRLDLVAVVEEVCGEVAGEEGGVDAVLLHRDVPAGPAGGVLHAPGRPADCAQVFVEHEARDDGAVAQVRVRRDECRANDRPEAVPDVHDLLRLHAERPVPCLHSQFSEDLELVLCLHDRVGVRVVGQACA